MLASNYVNYLKVSKFVKLNFGIVVEVVISLSWWQGSWVFGKLILRYPYPGFPDIGYPFKNCNIRRYQDLDP